MLKDLVKSIVLDDLDSILNKSFIYLNIKARESRKELEECRKLLEKATEDLSAKDGQILELKEEIRKMGAAYKQDILSKNAQISDLEEQLHNKCQLCEKLPEVTNQDHDNLNQENNNVNALVSMDQSDEQTTSGGQYVEQVISRKDMFNFIGRILGPRGMTKEKLEHETGCKIMIRGKGSMRNKKEEALRGHPGFEHLEDELHVLVECEDTELRARVKLASAMEHINRFLVPTVGLRLEKFQ